MYASFVALVSGYGLCSTKTSVIVKEGGINIAALGSELVLQALQLAIDACPLGLGDGDSAGRVAILL